ncbi:hypothetical protein [uncultured Cohaesibacter sp.]|uniref:hypothetical protein n=1 Tax=uncultured Cohaesibacter sp. TaxID=1002546 RepID=UPI0029C97B68|nr:hypothetical protein [uncultured Cohaesibacter sp.]
MTSEVTRDFHSLFWSARDRVRLKNWALSGKGALRIDLEITGAHELGDLVGQLKAIEAVQAQSKPPKSKR